MSKGARAMKRLISISSNPFVWSLACLGLFSFSSSTLAGDKKKLYCWDVNHERTCSDTLPPDAINQAHNVISATNGMQESQVKRTLTPEEETEQANAKAQNQSEQAALEIQRRTEKALLESYATEDELKRVFVNRKEMLDNNLSATTYGEHEIQRQLAALLQTAGNQELAQQPIPDELKNSIQTRLAALTTQHKLKLSIKQQQYSLNDEIQNTLERYRALKGQLQSPAPPTH